MMFFLSLVFYLVFGVLMTTVGVKLTDPIFWLISLNLIIIDRLAFVQGKERAEVELPKGKKKNATS